MLVPDDEKLSNLLTIAYPRCQVAETLQGGYCERSGKVEFAGLVLCERHAGQLEAQDRMALLEGIVSCLGLCLGSIPCAKTGTSLWWCEHSGHRRPENSLTPAKISDGTQKRSAHRKLLCPTAAFC